MFVESTKCLIFCINSKRRKKRGLPVAGEKASKDVKKLPVAGKVGDTSEKDKLGKPVDVKKSHEAENVKSTVDTALPEQGDGSLDDRSLTCVLFCIQCIYCILSRYSYLRS